MTFTVRQLTEEQKRREQEYRQFQSIERKLAAQPRVSRGKQESAIERARQKAVKSINQLSKSNQILFLKREAGRIDQAIKKESQARIPTLQDINKAGYNYGKAHPKSARLIYNSMSAQASIIRKIVPKEIGIPTARAMYAFSDGSIKGIRNEPVKTLAFFALPGAVGAVAKGARYVPIASKVVKSEKAMKAAAAVFDIGYTHNVYTRVNAPVVSHYVDGKVISETKKKMPDGSTQITQKVEQIPVTRNPSTSEQAERLGYIFSTEAGPMVFGSMGMSKVSSARFKQLSRPAVKTTTTKVIKTGGKAITKAKNIYKSTSSKTRNIVKSQRSKKISNLYLQIGVKHKQIELAKTPAEQAQLLKDLKRLESKITAEVAKKSKPQSSTLRRLLQDERATLYPSIQLQRAEVKPLPKRKVMVKERTKTKVLQELETLVDYKTAVKMGIVPKVKVEPKVKRKAIAAVKTKPKVRVKTKTKTKVRPLQKTKVKTAKRVKTTTKVIPAEKVKVVTKPKPKTKRGVKVQVEPKTEVKIKPEVETKVEVITVPKIKVKPKVKTKTKTVVTPKVKVKPLLRKKEAVGKKKKRKVKKGIKEAYVKNPVPSIKEFIG